MLNTTKHTIGINNKVKLHLKQIPSTKQNTKNTPILIKKLINEEIFFDNKKIYLGTLIFVIIALFITKEFIPPLVASLK